ncbi:MAG: sialate O-acetylesterase, partial [Lacunisphaera sp.]|nr:sialate O-acetylesterase [Lacunisphaera sp.]
QPIPVWGWGRPGEKITVSLDGLTMETVALSTGRWQITLPPRPASSTPARLIVKGGPSGEVAINDLLVGEVWLCSGQSNMEMWLQHTANADAEIAAADYASIRFFDTVHTVGETPAADVDGKWVHCSPQSAPTLSATAYYFGRELQRRLGVPIGLVCATWGGTPVQSWMSERALLSDPAFFSTYEQWGRTWAAYPRLKLVFDRDVEAWKARQMRAAGTGKAFDEPPPAAPPGPGHRFTPAGLFNGMIRPLMPCARRGVIWYQGEDNANDPEHYSALFAAMIRDWRAQWGGGDFPFLFVQLANYKGSPASPRAWARLREAQAQALFLPNTGMAVAIDIGEREDIHPRNKLEVGRRLALRALADVYGREVIADGPAMAKMESTAGTLTVSFIHAEGGLEVRGERATGFEIAGTDGEFFTAEAVVESNQVRLRSSRVATPVAVRYAWSNAPEANLYNRAGLPAAPFRTDRDPPPDPIR